MPVLGAVSIHNDGKALAVYHQRHAGVTADLVSAGAIHNHTLLYYAQTCKSRMPLPPPSDTLDQYVSCTLSMF